MPIFKSYQPIMSSFFALLLPSVTFPSLTFRWHVLSPPPACLLFLKFDTNVCVCFCQLGYVSFFWCVEHLAVLEEASAFNIRRQWLVYCLSPGAVSTSFATLQIKACNASNVQYTWKFLLPKMSVVSPFVESGLFLWYYKLHLPLTNCSFSC